MGNPRRWKALLRRQAGLISVNGLLDVGGTLYGTTYGAGTDNGTVFTYTP